MSTTAQTIIDKAFRRIGVLRTGQTPSTDARQDAYLALGNMMDQWNAQGWIPYVITRNEFSLVNGQHTYTFGSGGDWNIVQPARIDFASYTQLTGTSQLEYPIAIFTEQQWAQKIHLKNMTNALPTGIFPYGEFPVESIRVFPVPGSIAASTKIVLYVHTPLTQFSDLNTTQYTFRQGYEQAIIDNLAVNIWPMFVLNNKIGNTMSPAVMTTVYGEIKEAAARGLGIIKSNNQQQVEMTASTALDDNRGWYNIYGDTYWS